MKTEGRDPELIDQGRTSFGECSLIKRQRSLLEVSVLCEGRCSLTYVLEREPTVLESAVITRSEPLIVSHAGSCRGIAQHHVCVLANELPGLRTWGAGNVLRSTGSLPVDAGVFALGSVVANHGGDRTLANKGNQTRAKRFCPHTV